MKTVLKDDKNKPVRDSDHQKVEVKLDEELDIIYEYEGIEEADETVSELVENNFSRLRGIAEGNGFTTGEDLDNHLKPFVNQYMNNKYNKNHYIKSYAQKRNGDWKVRRFQTPLQYGAGAAHSFKTLLTDNNIKYKEKETVRGQKLEVMGVPDGFYTAWKVLTRSLDKQLELKDKGKSQLEGELRKAQKHTKAVTPTGRFQQAVSQLVKAMSSMPENTATERADKLTLIHDLVDDLDIEIGRIKAL